MTVSRASVEAQKPQTTRRSCYRCHRAFSTASVQARVYCPTCCHRHGFPAPEVPDA